MVDAIIKTIADAIVDGNIAFFLGAGANLYGRPPTAVHPPPPPPPPPPSVPPAPRSWPPGSLPSGSELARYLADKYGYTYTQGEPDLARVSEYAAITRGSASLYEKLHSVFNEECRPTGLHYFLADLPALLSRKVPPPRTVHQLLVTTNYDDLTERAFADRGQPLDLVWYGAQGEHQGRFLHLPSDHSGRPPIEIEKPNEYEITLESQSLLCKVHGAVKQDRPPPVAGDLYPYIVTEDSYVITEDDYINYFFSVPELPAFLGAALKQRGILFLGYSLSDWTLRLLLLRAWRRHHLRMASFAVMKDPLPYEPDFWTQYKVKIVDMDLFDFIDKLGGYLESLPDLSLRHRRE